MLIDSAKPRDARAIAALRTEVAQGMTREFGEGHWSACPSKALVLRQLKASQVLVAREGAEIIGTVRLATANAALFDASAFTPVTGALYVLGLAVAPAQRERGIGRQLMDAAKNAARDRAVHALWLDAYDHAAGAGKFYERCGFRRVGPAAFKEVPLIYYEWLVPREHQLIVLPAL